MTAWIAHAQMPLSSDPLADFFLDQAGRTPRHEYDHDREGEHVLVGTAERQRYGADGLQGGEQEAAEDGAVDAAQSADDGGGKTDHAEQKADAEIDLVVVEAVHDAGKGGQSRADGEGDEHDGGEVHP